MSYSGYAIPLNKPGPGLTIRSLPASSGKVTRGVRLGGSSSLGFSQDDQGLKVNLPGDLANSPVQAFSISGAIP